MWNGVGLLLHLLENAFSDIITIIVGCAFGRGKLIYKTATYFTCKSSQFESHLQRFLTKWHLPPQCSICIIVLRAVLNGITAINGKTIIWTKYASNTAVLPEHASNCQSDVCFRLLNKYRHSENWYINFDQTHVCRTLMIYLYACYCLFDPFSPHILN
jgi:hypothetical protein